jgi:hypothetical protein
MVVRCIPVVFSVDIRPACRPHFQFSTWRLDKTRKFLSVIRMVDLINALLDPLCKNHNAFAVPAKEIILRLPTTPVGNGNPIRLLPFFKNQVSQLRVMPGRIRPHLNAGWVSRNAIGHR